jgi:plastocyanin
MMKKLISVGVLVVVGAACSSGDDPAPQNDVNVTDVSIVPNRFDPPQVKIKVGQTVRWTWKGGEHNVVSGTDCSSAGDGIFRSGAPAQGGTFERKFDKAGSFPYYCEPHCKMNMKGEVVVE